MREELNILDNEHLLKLKKIYEIENSALKDVIAIKNRQFKKIDSLQKKYRKEILKYKKGK